MNLGKLEHDVDAPMSILFEDCHVSWRDDYPFEHVHDHGAGIFVGAPKTAGSITVRGGTVIGSAGAGISVDSKPLSGPTVTFADVTLNNTGKVDKGFPKPWMHVSPVMLIDEAGGIGGLWFESVRVIIGVTTWQPFLSYSHLPCRREPYFPPCPNVTGDIRGDIEVEWRGDEKQCTPLLLREGGVALKNGSVFGHRLLQNISLRCNQNPAP